MLDLLLLQYHSELSLTMLSTTRIQILCFKLLTYYVMKTTTEITFHTNFVTVKRMSNWTIDEDLPEVATQLNARSGRQHDDHMSNHWDNYGDRYQLRFRPIEKVKQLFWQKFPKPQQEEPETTVPPTETTEETTEVMPTEPGMEMVTEAMTEPAPKPEVPTEAPATMMPDMMMPTMPTHPTANSSSTTTSTTIMKPGAIPTHLGNTLKQLLLFGSPLEANIIEKHPAAPKPSKGKGFLSLFEVIKFENNKCNVSMGDIRAMEGVCYHEFECKSLGGISTERCAEGVGVCCIFLYGCGDVTNQPVSYFESPNYPMAVREMMICVMIVNLRERVQQLRLDFLMFELNRPTNGDCLDDQFIVSGQDINFVVPVLCGINTGQHLYIDVGNSYERKIYLSFFSKVPTGGRSFNIKITQLESDFAPDGCLQYFTESQGVIKSFNYDIDGSVVDNKEATYLNNMNYVICMLRAKETCSVTYATELLSGEQLDFQIVNKDEAENDLVPDGQAGAGIFNCPDDFIAINQVRLCGERINDGTANDDFTLHAPIKDTAAGPIILPFRSDDEYVGRGFRLVYQQELCL